MEDILFEQILIYGIILLVCVSIVLYYMKGKKSKSKAIEKKVEIAKEEGLFEPISLYPHIDLNVCIGSAACVISCPEKDILGIVDGVATVINTSNCIGHGACFHSCPVEAISLRIGTEKRGVELPHVNESFESNMKGIYIAGELGGMGLIKNSAEQGSQAIENIVKSKKSHKEGVLDVVIVGAGPAGISASLAAKKHNLSSVTLEQDSLGGTVFTYPRAKIVMTAPMDLPLYGKVKLYNTSKDELLNLWNEIITTYDLPIHEKTKVESIIPLENDTFKIQTSVGNTYYANQVLMAIGRGGTPRKLNIPGEESTKVAYRLLEPEQIKDKEIIVVGGGDSAIESVLLLKDTNNVILSYRKDKFSRLKPKNKQRILAAQEDGSIQIRYNTNLVSIAKDHVMIKTNESEDTVERIENNLVYIFAGGELPSKFLMNAGVKITKRFNHIMKKYR